MRLICRGYRVEEVPLKKLDPIKTDVLITSPRKWDPSRRPVVAASMGCHVKGVALPHPDPQCPRTMTLGVHRRFAFRPPEPDEALLTKFREFVFKWINSNIPKMSPV
jgi:hypothetical protein